MPLFFKKCLPQIVDDVLKGQTQLSLWNAMPERHRPLPLTKNGTTPAPKRQRVVGLQSHPIAEDFREATCGGLSLSAWQFPTSSRRHRSSSHEIKLFLCHNGKKAPPPLENSECWLEVEQHDGDAMVIVSEGRGEV